MTEEIKDVSDALQFLANTDESAAQAIAYAEYLKRSKDTKKAVVKMISTLSSDAARETEALASEEYKEHLIKLKDAESDALILKNKRHTLELRIEIWRSKNANRRQAGGNI